MRYRDYLDKALAAAPPAIRSYATALLAPQWRTVWEEMAGAPRDSLDGAHRHRVDRFLDGAIRPRRGPPRRPAKRGLIFYATRTESTKRRRRKAKGLRESTTVSAQVQGQPEGDTVATI